MNKELRKKLIQEYKQKELEKELGSENSIVSNFAKLKLGLASKSLSKADILDAPDEQLINLIYNKIEEVAEITYRENPQIHKCRENVISSFSRYLQLIYYTQQFEMLVEIGDCDKYFENTPIEEVEIVAESYSIIGFQNLSIQILDVASGIAEASIIELEYAKLKQNIQNSKIDFVRKNYSQFQLN